MAEEMWRWADPNGQQRRVRLDELRAALAGGVIAPNTPVWRSGWTAWQPAHDVPELSTSALSAANGVMLNIPPPPLAVVAVQHEFEASSAPPPSVDEGEPPPPPTYVPMPVRPVSVPPPPGSSAKNLGDPSSSKKVLSAAKAAESSPKVADAVKPTPSKPPPPVPKSMKPPPPAGATPEPAAAAPAAGMGKSMGTMLMFGGAAAGDQPDAAPAVAKAPEPPRVNAQSQSNIPTVIGGAPPPLEEISSSMLLEAAESQPKLPASGPIGPDGLPPATDPIRRSTPDEGEDEEPAGVPGARSSRRGLVSLAGDLAAVKPKNKFVLPVFAVLGGLLAITILAGIVTLVRSIAGGKDDKDDPKKLATSSTASATTTTSSATAATTATASATATTSSSASAIVTPPPADKPAAAGAYDTCKMQGSTHVVAPRAMVAVGVEVGSTPQGHLVGFASTFKEAMGVLLDPTSMGATATEKAVSPDIIKRVVPGVSGGKVVPAVDSDKRGDVMTHRRASSNLAVDMGVAEGHLVWAPRLGQSHAKLFKLPGNEPIEALRVVPLQNEKGYAFAFRQGSNVIFGAARGEAMLAPAGELRVVAGLGKVVGSPAIAVSDDTIMVAWADRAAPADPWTIRLSHAKVGEGGEITSIFSTPSGGAGGKTMAPALAPLGGKKYLLAWTEGPAKSNQVRATVIGADGAPTGEAMLLSPAGTNAGQAQVAVGEGGKAVAAFLAERGKRYEVTAVSLLCEKK